MLIVTVMCIYTMHIQSAARTKIGPQIKNYSDLGLTLFGSVVKAMIDVMIIVGRMGTAIAYLIFNGTTIDEVICHQTGGEVCGMKPFYIVFCVLILTPAMWIRTMKKLYYVSIFGLVVMVFGLSVIMYYDVIYIRDNTYPE